MTAHNGVSAPGNGLRQYFLNAFFLIALAGCGGASEPAAETRPTYRYALTASFDGPFAVLGDGAGMTEVDDRFEVIFDCCTPEGESLSDPVLANYGARLVEPQAAEAGCEAPERTSAFDLAEVKTSAVEKGPVLTLTYATSRSGAKTPLACRGDTRTIAPRTTETALRLAVPGDLLDKSNGGPVEVTEDGWTFSWTRLPLPSP